MDKDTRNAIERATQKARKLLEEDFAAQLEGDFDVHPDGEVGSTAGGHLSARDAYRRDRIVAAIEHKRAGGMTAADAARDYLRDAAFTTLNRFVALKMLEARELVQECITKGEQSGGYREFCGMAPGLPLLSESAGYRIYIESLFDELSTEVKVLFDRREPSSVLWPRRRTFEQLLEILNAADLSRVWGEDETIGWVYQFFNGQDERRKMREESQAPRNSRELAVRNQFFTPRYVVQFLTDNTLGRIWYEMRDTNTALVDKCEYMVRKPGETNPSRAKKDPRDLRVLDPACGSGHFLLYAFDLLVTIYEEAWSDQGSAVCDATGRTLVEDFPTIESLRSALPGLVLANNLFGVDIDSRCAQIAQFALWMRAQRAFHSFGITRGARPLIRKSNIVVAEPVVSGEAVIKEFVSKLNSVALRDVFSRFVEYLSHAGEMGFLLRIEKLLGNVNTPADLFAPSEAAIRDAIETFMAGDVGRLGARRKLFADDAGHGIELLGIAASKFDVVLMNPPFGEATPAAAERIGKAFASAKHDIGMAFVSRSLELLATGGMAGCITSRAFIGNEKMKKWRHSALLGGEGALVCLADLGIGVLDALVETCAYTIAASVKDNDRASADFITVMNERAKEAALLRHIKERSARSVSLATFRSLPDEVMCYWLPSALLRAVAVQPSLSAREGTAVQGLATGDDFRFFRLRWEVSGEAVGAKRRWTTLAKGGEYAPFADMFTLLVKWERDGAELKAHVTTQYPYLKGDWGWVVKNSSFYLKPGLTYPERTTSDFSPRILPSGVIFSAVGQGLFFPNESALWGYLGGAYTRLFKLLVDAFLGSGDSSVSGSAAKHIRSGLLNVLPHPLPNPSENVVIRVRAGVERRRSELSLDERNPEFAGIAIASASLDEFARGVTSRSLAGAVDSLEDNAAIEKEQILAWSLTDADLSAIDTEYGPHPLAYKGANVGPSDLQKIAYMDIAQLSDAAVARHGARRQLTKKSFVCDRHLELASHLIQADPRVIAADPAYLAARTDSARRDLAHSLASIAFGTAIGRYRESVIRACGEGDELRDPFAELPGVPPAVAEAQAWREDFGVLVDDPNEARDLELRITAVFGNWFGERSADWINEIRRELDCGEDGLRTWYAKSFFQEHIRNYSGSRRKAPIYWQLAIPSAGYSVWLYINAFSKDTMFRVQSEYVAPKVAHEERRLALLSEQLRGGATPAQRNQLAGQTLLVEQLRTFLDEVKMVAPLWNPNLDDGVIINFAPLWRLVPQQASWQRELKATWDALCEGSYDWSHLAMHLWPERVVPKCARNRSIAIAHGLEHVFWIEGAGGLWAPRETPAASIDRLVHERTALAVKSALKRLLEAPVASGKHVGRRNGGRRAASVVTEEGYS
jgi:hypothetical protein